MMEGLGKIFVVLGIGLIVAGLILWFGDGRLSWFGHLPGDFRVEKGNFRFYFPFTSMLLLSVVVSLFWWLIKKL